MHAGWAIKANFPLLNSGRVFRLDWYIVMQQFVTTMMVLLALFSRVIPQVGPPGMTCMLVSLVCLCRHCP